MHVPDGFLDLKTVATTGIVAASGVGWALRRLKRTLPRRRVPLMGLAASFLFVAQMLNFPVAAGTSGHLIGAVLAAVLLGPSAAVVVVTAVLVVQALLFADGGILALGANICNMAIVAVVGGYAAFRGLTRLLPGERGLLAATAFASWWSILLAAIACAAELAVSGVAPWRLVFPAMAGVHMVIGVGEGLIASLVIAAILRTRPDLVWATAGTSGAGAPSSKLRLPITFVLLIVVVLVVFGVPLASTRPDGLEWVAEMLGFASRAAGPMVPAPMSDYQAPAMASSIAATWAAALVGALVVFLLSYGLAIMLARRPSAISSASARG
jgi:cobalt/nickel transport system permease protein